MYTGTLISGLMATVERAEWSVQQRRVAEERELRRMFALQVAQAQVSQQVSQMQNSQLQHETVLAGAA
jgi:hypothetical protein